ncbi:Spy/CpxP family protein refolding chaperone [Prosthecobacter sp.]|uniref:Spy/CpxP family protein refolding chaperone n=1 Tax=Prosthecobacter sp. TaxID=1965333 RepID=UPI0037845C14
MKRTLLTSLLLCVCPLLAADSPAPKNDPFAGAFVPPEVIMQLQSQIGLTQEQQEAIKARLLKTQSSYGELKKKLETENTALAALVKQERPEESAVLAQLDKVLDAEREVKHLHVGLMVAVKNLLNAEQQTKLREMTKNGGAQIADATRARLMQKVESVKTGVQTYAASGRDPAEILQAMEQKFRPLIEAGKTAEAEAELDRLLELLKPESK